MFSISREAIEFLNSSANNIEANYDMDNYILALSWPIFQDGISDQIRGPQICLFSKDDLKNLEIMYNVDGRDIYSNFDQEKLEIAKNRKLHYDGKILIYI